MKPIAIFFRPGGFYPVKMMDPATCGKSLETQAADHAGLNPGTTRVEDIEGNILWGTDPDSADVINLNERREAKA